MADYAGYRGACQRRGCIMHPASYPLPGGCFRKIPLREKPRAASDQAATTRKLAMNDVIVTQNVLFSGADAATDERCTRAISVLPPAPMIDMDRDREQGECEMSLSFAIEMNGERVRAAVTCRLHSSAETIAPNSLSLDVLSTRLPLSLSPQEGGISEGSNGTPRGV